LHWYMARNWERLQKEHTLHHFHPLVEVDLPLLLMILIQRWILFWIESHLFLLWCIHHIFHLIVLWIWCMDFCDIVLSLMTLLALLQNVS
jgi:hypothetical protein